MENHPTAEDFERFLQSSPRPSNSQCNASVVRHLLKECQVCRETLAGLRGGRALLTRLLEIPVPQTGPSDLGPAKGYNYDWAFARTERAVVAALVAGGPAPGLPERLAELARLPEREQVRRVSAGGRFADPELIRCLVDRSHAARFQSPKKTLHLSSLARLAAEACTEETAGGAAQLADLQAEAWRAFGNAQRICGNRAEAETAFRIARQKYEEGTGSPWILAILLAQLSSLRTSHNQFGEAVRLAEEAGRIYLELGQDHLLAGTMVQKAIPLLYSGEVETAIDLFRDAIPLIDREEEPQLFLAAYHNLARCYIDLGRPDEALSFFVEAKPLYRQCKDPLILLRATWQEGQLLREIGHLENAEVALLRAREGFSDQGLAYETAMISLDLADVYAKMDRTEDLRRTILEAMPIFRSLCLEREVLVSLLRLRQAAGLEPAGEG